MSSTEIINPADDNPDAPMGYGFTEYKDSGQEDFDWWGGKFGCTRIFDGPWQNRLAFIFSLASQVYDVDGHQVAFPPAFHPEIGGIFACSASIKGMAKTDRTIATNYIKHGFARITVKYAGLPIKGGHKKDQPKNNKLDPFIEEELQSTTEIVPIKVNIPVYTGETGSTQLTPDAPIVGYDSQGIPLYPNVTNWQDFQTLKEESKNKKITVINYKLKIPLILSPRWQSIQDASGCINFISFETPSGLIAASGTLLYNGPAGITKRELLNGTTCWELIHSFAYLRQGWNNRPEGSVSGKGKSARAVVKWVPIIPALYDPYVFQDIFRAVLSAEEQQLLEAINGTGPLTNV